jgi:hypothetical protein
VRVLCAFMFCPRIERVYRDGGWQLFYKPPQGYPLHRTLSHITFAQLTNRANPFVFLDTVAYA